jgi:hypothetical protein
MTPYSKLTSDYEDYLLHLIFRRGMTISGCIHNAYLDLNRTLHGMRKLPQRTDIRTKAEASLKLAKSATYRQNKDRRDNNQP